MSVLDHRNSTERNLSASGTFLGQWLDILNHFTATIFLNADVAGTLTIQYSSNKSTVLYSSDTTHTSGQQIIQTTHSAKYFRVRYVNGASNQSTFQIQTIHRQNLQTASTSINSSGSTNMTVQNNYLMDVATGDVSGSSIVFVQGYNPTLTTSWRHLWYEGVNNYNFLQAASTVRIKSGGNSNDTLAGSGARSVTISGLDENWDLVSETINTNGASASSATSTTFIRVNSAYVATVGTYSDRNTGDITIETTGGVILAIIPARYSISSSSIYTVPRNYRAHVIYYSISPHTSGACDVQFRYRTNADDVVVPVSPIITIHEIFDVNDEFHEQFHSLPAISGKTDLLVRAKFQSGSGTIACNYMILLVSTS